MAHCECGCGQLAQRRFIKGHNRRRRNVVSEYLVDANGCWCWQLSCDKDGYGVKGGRPAHIVYYEARFGPVPIGLELDHLCRNIICVYTDHLEAVTPTENKRRSRTTKLTVEKIHEIRASTEARSYLARQYGVSVSNIKHIRARESWKDI